MADIDLILTDFPNLRRHHWRITSNVDDRYNCIAWAAGSVTEVWWPQPDDYWPPGVPAEETVAAFVQAFATVGYASCENGDCENEIEKIALFAVNGRPKHAARQLEDGKWSSKLGLGNDIEHEDPDDVAGDLYGVVVQYLKRPRP